MNVIVSNRQKEIIDNANIDAIKDLNGLFNVNDLISKFKNYFFSKMILDATSVVDFASKEVLSTLADEIGAEKLIILLPSSPEPPLEFIKLLIELKIYNFTTNIDDVIKFIEKPNTYEDAIKLVDSAFSDNVYVDNSIKEDGNSMPSDNYEKEKTNDIFGGNSQSQSSLGDILNNMNLNNIPEQSDDADNTSMDNEQDDSNGYDFPNTNNINSLQSYNDVSDSNTMENSLQNMSSTINNEQNTNSSIDYGNVINNVSYNVLGNNEQNENTKLDFNSSGNNNIFLVTDDFNNSNNVVFNKPQKLVIGFKGVTIHSGCTSLIYMLHKMLINMKKNVLSVEIGKNDFRLFRDNKMISITANDMVDFIKNANEDIILIDLNDCNNTDVCNEVLYLVEPSTIKLNGLMATNRDIFKELKDKKVLLNKSLLSPNDIRTLESEAGLKFFYNIEPLNDRIFNDSISRLLNLLEIK